MRQLNHRENNKKVGMVVAGIIVKVKVFVCVRVCVCVYV